MAPGPAARFAGRLRISLVDRALRPMATHPDDAHRGEPDATKIQVAFDPANIMLAQADAVITHAGLAG